MERRSVPSVQAIKADPRDKENTPAGGVVGAAGVVATLVATGACFHFTNNGNGAFLVFGAGIIATAVLAGLADGSL